MKIKKQRCSDDRELNQARSKPDTVDQPVKTARTFFHHYNSTQYWNTDSFLKGTLRRRIAYIFFGPSWKYILSDIFL